MGRLKLLDTQALFTVQHVSSLVHRLPRQASEVRLQINTVLAAQGGVREVCGDWGSEVECIVCNTILT